MNQQLFQRLKVWRGMQAQKEGVELYRVLPNSALAEIAQVIPRNQKEFMSIKGIKESRFKKYGAQLLAMTTDVADVQSESIIFQKPDILLASEASDVQEPDVFENISSQRTLYTVSSFLDTLNMVFEEMVVRIQGEVSSVDERDKTIYFTLKDPVDDSIVQCLIFRYQYMVSGVTLAIGQEVIIEGTPGIWKPAGRLSVKATSIEVSGVGALQKAYDELKAKLQSEGVFASERKKQLPPLPQRIGLITSQQGAAIGDFLMNLGKHGLNISLYSSSVEGKRAVYELIDAVRYFRRHAHLYDAVVIIRGGGSLESLQAFNNEALVREIINMPIPVLAGIGHEKDVSLVAMAADVMVSTPTATARYVHQRYVDAMRDVDRLHIQLFESFRTVLYANRQLLDEYGVKIPRFLQSLIEYYTLIAYRFRRVLEKYDFSLGVLQNVLNQRIGLIFDRYTEMSRRAAVKLDYGDSVLKLHDPQRLLKLGYSYIKKDRKVIRSIQQLQKNDTVTLYMYDGNTEAKIQ